MNQYPNSGKISNNRYKDGDERKPDMVGEIVMQRSALKQLMEEADGDDITIKLSVYKKQGQYGEFWSVKWNNYKKREDAPAPRPQPRSNDQDQDVPF